MHTYVLKVINPQGRLTPLRNLRCNAQNKLCADRKGGTSQKGRGREGQEILRAEPLKKNPQPRGFPQMAVAIMLQYVCFLNTH